MQNLIITTGHERVKKLQQVLDNENERYHLVQSVIPALTEEYYGCKVFNKGNSGLCIGHLRALEKVIQLNENCNIFEDDEILHNNYIEKRTELLLEINKIDKNWSYINLNALRATGIKVSENFLQIQKDHRKHCRNTGYVNNIWMSNFCITPTFAKVLYDKIINKSIFWKEDKVRKRNLQNCFHKHVYDQFAVLHMHSISNQYNLYVCDKKNKISTHDEGLSIRLKNNRYK